MIERSHPVLSVGARCRLLSISRSSFYYAPQGETEMNLTLMVDRPAVPGNPVLRRPSDDLAPAQLQGPWPQWGRVSPKTATG